MFGIMEPAHSCGAKKSGQARQQRLHYCGTCKTIGKHYGHSARLLLNFDTVFLAELLSVLGEEKTETWDAGYQAVNRCWTMPTTAAEQMPTSLRFAAAVNVVLGQMKLHDGWLDRAKLRYKIGHWFLSKAHRKALNALKNFGLDIAVFARESDRQAALESATADPTLDLETRLERFAAPTAAMTAEVFAAGAVAVGRPELADAMRALGAGFGRLAYALDAFEDVEKDLATRQFNPLAQHFQPEHGRVAETQLDEARAVLLRWAEAVAADFQQVVPAELAEMHAARLRANAMLILYQTRWEYQTPLKRTWAAWLQFLRWLGFYRQPQQTDPANLQIARADCDCDCNCGSCETCDDCGCECCDCDCCCCCRGRRKRYGR